MSETNIGKIQLPDTPDLKAIVHTPATNQQIKKERSFQESTEAIRNALPPIH